jgi:hypothetical protein
LGFIFFIQGEGFNKYNDHRTGEYKIYKYWRNAPEHIDDVPVEQDDRDPDTAADKNNQEAKQSSTEMGKVCNIISLEISKTAK